MGLFTSLQTPIRHGDPFLDAVVSMTTSDNNTPYTGIRALKNSDVFTAVKIIASDIASNELQLLKQGKTEESEALLMFNERPNDYTDGWHFKFALACNMLLNGNSYAEIKRDGTKIDSFHLIPNSKVTIKQSSAGHLTYEVEQDNGTSRKLSAENVLHFKFFTQDGLVGTSPLYALKDELDIQKSGNKTLFNFFTRGVNGSGILKVQKSDLDKSAKEAIRTKFEEANGSSNGDNALRTIILDDTMDYKPIEINTDVLNLVNSNDWTTKQIAKVYGISTDRLGVEAQHSSNVQSNMMYLQNTLIHYFKSFISEIGNKLISLENESILRFNPDRLMESDPQTTLENTVKAVQSTLMTINEGRAKLGLSPIDGGDRLLTSLNYTHYDTLEAYQQTKEVAMNGN